MEELKAELGRRIEFIQESANVPKGTLGTIIRIYSAEEVRRTGSAFRAIWDNGAHGDPSGWCYSGRAVGQSIRLLEDFHPVEFMEVELHNGDVGRVTQTNYIRSHNGPCIKIDWKSGREDVYLMPGNRGSMWDEGDIWPKGHRPHKINGLAVYGAGPRTVHAQELDPKEVIKKLMAENDKLRANIERANIERIPCDHEKEITMRRAECERLAILMCQYERGLADQQAITHDLKQQLKEAHAEIGKLRMRK